MARLIADAGNVAVVAVISLYRADRDAGRSLHEEAGLRFVEVFVATPLAECERRDPQRLYARARAGELAHFTGVDDPHEPPQHPEATASPEIPIEATVQTIARLLEAS
jgi:bifunctional enzyme CysN/CysC